MRLIEITANNQGQRVDKFMLKLLPGMSKAFCYKMFRKKNITLNGKKIKGSEILRERDSLKVFFTDATYEKFALPDATDGAQEVPLPKVIFEDEHLLILNKEAGIFSQPDPRGVSIIEQIKAHHRAMGNALPEGFVPGVANRLDRNTSGIILSAKSQQAIQRLNHMVMAKEVDKAYRTIVLGDVKGPMDLKGYLKKSGSRNKVTLSQNPEDGDFIHTVITPLRGNGAYTELKVVIHTGKSHQIRAHLAGENHPIIGDGKYGDHLTNKAFRREQGLRHHLLHAYSYALKGEGEFADRYSEPFEAALPPLYKQIAEALFDG